MKTKDYAIVTIVFALILALGMVGGTWTTTSARGTVPTSPPAKEPNPTPPPLPPPPPYRQLIPVTGACAGAELAKVGDVTLCIADGSMDKAYEVDFEVATTIPGAGQITLLTPVFNIYLVDGVRIIPNYKFSENAALTVDLTPDTLEQFKKNNLASLMWYNQQSGKWEKIVATVEGGKLTAMVSTTGLFVLAIPK